MNSPKAGHYQVGSGDETATLIAGDLLTAGQPARGTTWRNERDDRWLDRVWSATGADDPQAALMWLIGGVVHLHQASGPRQPMRGA